MTRTFDILPRSETLGFWDVSPEGDAPVATEVGLRSDSPHRFNALTGDAPPKEMHHVWQRSLYSVQHFTYRTSRYNALR